MRNITVSVDEDTHRLARVRAAELNTSVSALVREYLQSLVDPRNQGRSPNLPRVPTAEEQRSRSLNEVLTDFDARRIGLDMAENLPRDALYDRDDSR